jgi:hypothetical protein
MKHAFALILTVLILSSMITSCEKEKPDPELVSLTYSAEDKDSNIVVAPPNTSFGEIYIQGAKSDLNGSTSSGTPLEIAGTINDLNQKVSIKFNSNTPATGEYTLVTNAPNGNQFTLRYELKFNNQIFTYVGSGASKKLSLSYPTPNKPKIEIKSTSTITIANPSPASGAPFTSRTLYGQIIVN